MRRLSRILGEGQKNCDFVFGVDRKSALKVFFLKGTIHYKWRQSALMGGIGNNKAVAPFCACRSFVFTSATQVETERRKEMKALSHHPHATRQERRFLMKHLSRCSQYSALRQTGRRHRTQSRHVFHHRTDDQSWQTPGEGAE